MNMRLCGDDHQPGRNYGTKVFGAGWESLEGCYCRNRKNWMELETGTVTTCWPFCNTSGFVTDVQAVAGRRLAVDSSVKPGTFNGHESTTEPPERATLKPGSGVSS